MSGGQPTVLVKKADGSTERVPLDVFRKQKKQPEPQTQKDTKQSPQPRQTKSVQKSEPKVEKKQFEKKVAEKKVHDIPSLSFKGVIKKAPKKEPEKKEVSQLLPQEEAPHELSTTTPVKHIFVDEAEAALEWDKDDHASLLDEEMPEVEDLKQRGAVHETHKDITKGMGVQKGVSKELKPRLASLVVSFKKGIRSDDQFVEYAMRDVTRGGLGLMEPQARELLEQTKKEYTPSASSKPIVLPRPIEPQMKKPPVSAQKSVVPNMAPPKLVVPPRAVPNTPSPLLKHDVTPSQGISRIQGPEDEAQNFTLVDLRRLSRDPKVAVDMLLAKFEGWKEESFLLYMKTRDAWKVSPLNKKYTSTTSQALREGIPVQDILNKDTSPDRMTMEEYTSIVLFNKKLDV